MLAGLPMYDWPEISAATDAFWNVLADSLRRRGIDAPKALARQDDLAAMWYSPDLVFGQTCALPFAMDLHAHVRLIGSPAYDIGCAPGCYYSLLIVPKGRSTDLASFRGPAAAFDEAADMISPSLRGELLLTGFLRRKAQDYAGVARDWRSIEAHLPPKIAYSLKSFAMRR